MKNKAIFKFNNGLLALLCSKCSIIMKTGKDFTKEEHNAAKGYKIMKPRYCKNCKHNETKI